MLKRSLALSTPLFVAFSGHALAGQYDKPGFVTKEEKGRLWVFKEGSKELEAFEKSGEPALSVIRIGEGPQGITLKGPSNEVLQAYLDSK